jgi:hypothetical protein
MNTTQIGEGEIGEGEVVDSWTRAKGFQGEEGEKGKMSWKRESLRTRVLFDVDNDFF